MIFMADNISCMPDIFEAEPTDLLLRPVCEKNLRRALDRAFMYLEANRTQIFEICSRYKKRRIFYQDILYLESDRRYLTIYQREGQERIMMRMQDALEQLPDYFVRCHQSYAVNLRYVMEFSRQWIVLQTDMIKIPVSRSRYEDVKKRLSRIAGSMSVL